MTNEPTELDSLLATGRALRARREELEEQLELTRRESRALAIRLLFDHGYSINKTSSVTGHMRPTLKVWIESELAKRQPHVLPEHLRS